MEAIKHYKCLTDLKKIISELGDIKSRQIIQGNHPTLYKDKSEGKYRTVLGIRICDYRFSPDEKWVLPDNQMGLSFSATWENLKFVHGMFSKGKKPVDVFWVLSEADIPPGLKFVEDETNQGHYFLTVTEQMLVEQLVAKLKLVSYRLSVIKGGGRAI
ncbi:hypothetical protein CBP51_05260 [Cellvibrio mixtus]|uniref:Uncharacterized protein n=1 Tax=Cellvibrio mixtus TaxID=39650 RepID=A0A266Q962_9GAMM|nr:MULTISPECIES: hypothetical protein [Cellvibrio]OZY86437.1 hypothetical protein CBP51_05260 [Cellvibrio mixtus]